MEIQRFKTWIPQSIGGSMLDMAVPASDFDRVLAERDALQQLLNARDEELGKLRELAKKARAELLEIKASIGFRGETLQVIGALDMALENQA